MGCTESKEEDEGEMEFHNFGAAPPTSSGNLKRPQRRRSIKNSDGAKKGVNGTSSRGEDKRNPLTSPKDPSAKFAAHDSPAHTGGVHGQAAQPHEEVVSPTAAVPDDEEELSSISSHSINVPAPMPMTSSVLKAATPGGPESAVEIRDELHSEVSVSGLDTSEIDHSENSKHEHPFGLSESNLRLMETHLHPMNRERIVNWLAAVDIPRRTTESEMSSSMSGAASSMLSDIEPPSRHKKNSVSQSPMKDAGSPDDAKRRRASRKSGNTSPAAEVGVATAFGFDGNFIADGSSSDAMSAKDSEWMYNLDELHEEYTARRGDKPSNGKDAPLSNSGGKHSRGRTPSHKPGK